jgi:hypothetical protein
MFTEMNAPEGAYLVASWRVGGDTKTQCGLTI